jgi:hypothetical protein
MSGETKKSRWWSRAWIWWASLALFLYPLSMGPAYRWAFFDATLVMDRFDTLSTVYAPIR